MTDIGFPPIIGKKPKILILGSMPSQKSLEKQQYYGHPQNAFWKIMSQIFDFPLDLDYSKKTKLIEDKGVSIWDVVHSCTRPGSLDSSIKKDTVIENNIPDLVAQNPSIKIILCNGGTAHQLFQKHFKVWIKNNPNIEIIKMPSTSLAHASLNFKQKYEIWLKAISCVDYAGKNPQTPTKG